jgi:hypothetical protein
MALPWRIHFPGNKAWGLKGDFMKKGMLLFLAVVLSAGSVQAAQGSEAVDFFGAIFNIIENQINKDKPGSPAVDNKVILKETQNKIVLGRVFITPRTSVDTVNFPACGKKSANTRVTRLRFIVNNEDVFIDAFRVQYANGGTETFNVREGFNDGESSRWYDIKGAARCIVAISARGQVASNHNGGGNHGGGNHGGKPGKPGFSFNFGNGGVSFNGGKFNNNNTRAVINFVGLKDSGNAFPF